MASKWDAANYDLGVDYGGVNTDYTSGNIFGGAAPSFDWGAGDTTDWYQTPQIDRTGAYDLPGLSGTGALRSSGESRDERSPVWMKALESALGYKTYGSSSTAPGRQKRSKRAGVGGGEIAAQGRGYTVYQPGPTQKTETRSRQSSGLGSTLGTLAGIGVSMIPGVGQAAAAAAPMIGRTVGGFFG